MCTKAGFLLVPVPGYLPSSNDLEQTNADQIIQTANEEVTSTKKEMQVIMQGGNKHPHINQSGSFSRLRSFKLNDMGVQFEQDKPNHIPCREPTDTSRPWYKRKSPNINTKRKKSSMKHTAGTSTH